VLYLACHATSTSILGSVLMLHASWEHLRLLLPSDGLPRAGRCQWNGERRRCPGSRPTRHLVMACGAVWLPFLARAYTASFCLELVVSD
jgi:hypothetical protein